MRLPKNMESCMIKCPEIKISVLNTEGHYTKPEVTARQKRFCLKPWR